jgi:hypothetical protein
MAINNLSARLEKLREASGSLEPSLSPISARLHSMRLRVGKHEFSGAEFTRWQNSDPWNNHYNFKDWNDFGDCW